LRLIRLNPFISSSYKHINARQRLRNHVVDAMSLSFSARSSRVRLGSFPSGLRRLALAFKLPRFTLLMRGRFHRHFEHAVPRCRRGLVYVHAFRQRQPSKEFSVASFAAIIALALFFILAMAFALDCQRSEERR